MGDVVVNEEEDKLLFIGSKALTLRGSGPLTLSTTAVECTGPSHTTAQCPMTIKFAVLYITVGASAAEGKRERGASRSKAIV